MYDKEKKTIMNKEEIRQMLVSWMKRGKPLPTSQEIGLVQCQLLLLILDNLDSLGDDIDTMREETRQYAIEC